jgi:hypothetical protein
MAGFAIGSSVTFPGVLQGVATKMRSLDHRFHGFKKQLCSLKCLIINYFFRLDVRCDQNEPFCKMVLMLQRAKASFVTLNFDKFY